MRAFMVIAALLIPLAAQAQEIYRWVDKQGVVHYSDQPGSPDAKLIEHAGLNTYESEPQGGSNYPAAPPPAGPDYRGLSISSPTANESFFGGGQTIALKAELSGFLIPGHQQVFFFNGERVAAARDFSAVLTGVERGSHFLRAAVLDENGVAAISSDQITFHVRLPSTQNPQGGPQVRPPPPKKPGG